MAVRNFLEPQAAKLLVRIDARREGSLMAETWYVVQVGDVVGPEVVANTAAVALEPSAKGRGAAAALEVLGVVASGVAVSDVAGVSGSACDELDVMGAELGDAHS